MEQLEGNANYPVLLLTLTASSDQEVQPPIKLAAAINLKNLVKRHWQMVSLFIKEVEIIILTEILYNQVM